jgi:hypothetical protein
MGERAHSAKSVASEPSRISPTVVQSADVNAFRTLVENRTCREDRRREAYHRDRELADSGKGPMGPLLRGRITAPDQAPGCGARKFSSAGYRAACFHRSRPVLPAGFSFAFAGRGELLMLPLPFKAMLPLGHARKSGGPPPLERSFNVKRDTTHNQSSGFAVAPGLEGLNALGPLKVHPKWRGGGPFPWIKPVNIARKSPCFAATVPSVTRVTATEGRNRE